MPDSFDSNDAEPNGRYQVPRPTMADAYAVLARLHGADLTEKWSSLLAIAKLNGRETDADSLDRLLAAMRTADPVTSLYSRSLAIRVAAHRHLTAAKDVIHAVG